MRPSRRSYMIWVAMIALGVIAGLGCESVSLRAMKIYMQQQNWEKALEQGYQATRQDPSDAQAWFNMSYVASQLDRFDIMLDAMARTHHLTSEYDDAIRDIKTVEYNDLYNRAVAQYSGGELEAAARKLGTASLIQPERAHAHKVLGMIAQRQGNTELAVEHYARVLEIDPADVEVARLHSAILADSEDRETAISAIEGGGDLAGNKVGTGGSSARRATESSSPARQSMGPSIDIAVVEFIAVEIRETEAQILSDRLRVELGNTGRFQVIERERMDEILREQGFQQSGLCRTDQCVVEIGQLIGVSRIVAGTIGKLGSTYTVTARMVDVETGRIVAQEAYDCRCEVDELLSGMRNVALMLARASG